MDRRLELHHRLQQLYESATGASSANRVWFQPPASVRLEYPCLIYKLSDMPVEHANNHPYKLDSQYELTVIDRDPLGPLRTQVALLPECAMIRVYESDNLHHYVFRIYD